MKLADLRNPVRFDWLTDQGFRLDASPYLSGAYEARKLVEWLPGTRPLQDLVRATNGIFHAGRSSRRWVTDPDYGVPFFSSTDILEADSSFLPLIAKSAVKDNPRLLIQRDWTLITRSGTVGRMAYARPDIDGFACSEHVLRVAADTGKVSPGYLYAFLSSRYGVPMITNAAYGAIVQHIEPDHIAGLPVPRFSSEVEEEIHGYVQAAADLRVRFQAGVTSATQDLFESAGLAELFDPRWHDQPREVGFTVARLGLETLRALNLSPRAQRIIGKLASVPHRTLGEICAEGQLSRGNRFARIDSEPGYGYRLVGQRQGPWIRPEGRWIIAPQAVLDDIRAADESVLVCARGTLGENEVYCRSIFVTGRWQREFVFSEDFLRIVSGDPDIPGSYLFAFLRSEAAFRIFRSLSTGSKQQDIHEELRRQIPVPECSPMDRKRIAETVRQAYRWRDEADDLEDRAQELLDAAVRDAAGADLRQDGDLAHRQREAYETGNGSDHQRRGAR
jgi:type I restriction enzyme S subunit